MTAINTWLGPAAIYGGWNGTTNITEYSFNSATTGLAWIFEVPKDGTIDRVGFYVSTKTGTPPAFNVGLFTEDNAGAPTSTPYGGSSTESYTPTSTGYKWITLATPATANAGDIVCLNVYPGGTAPDTSNYFRVPSSNGLQRAGKLRSVANAIGTGAGSFAVKYSDGSIFGCPIASLATYDSIKSTTTPDEVGAKFVPPFDMTVNGVVLTSGYITANMAFDVVLYDSANNVLASRSIADTDNVTSTYWSYMFDAVALTAGQTYRVVWKPTSNLALYANKLIFESAAGRAALPGGAWSMRTYRVDGGAWTDVDTNLFPFALIVTEIVTDIEISSRFAYIG